MCNNDKCKFMLNVRKEDRVPQRFREENSVGDPCVFSPDPTDPGSLGQGSGGSGSGSLKNISNINKCLS